METRHLPPPWTVEDIGAAFIVKDSAGQKLRLFGLRLELFAR
jgi:hypothetical protein